MELREVSISDILKERAAASPESPALAGPKYFCTYADLDAVTDLWGQKLLRSGIRAGEHVGIWGNNSHLYLLMFLALSKIGALPVLFNSLYRLQELKAVVEYADVHLLFYDKGACRQEGEKIAKKLRHQLRDLRVEALQDFDSDMEKCLLPEWEKELRKRSLQTGCKDAALMLFTSGTTSLPKGVLLSHYNVVNNAACLVEEMHWSEKDKMCLAVPMFHCFGITASILTAILAGASLYILENARTTGLWEAVEQAGCTILNGVPSMFLAMIRKEEYRNREAGGLRSGIIAGSPLSEQEYTEIAQRFYRAKIQSSYGQTESSPCISIVAYEEDFERKKNSAGHIIEHVKARIADIRSEEVHYHSEEARLACLAGGRCICGEIQIQGYNVMLGYYKTDKSAAFTKDGWLKTGDIGYFDEYGNLHITGRMKEMIIRAGENISPCEIEERIREIQGISEVKVVGVGAEVLQEEIVAFIVADASLPSDAEIQRCLQEKMAYYKVPKRLIHLKALPKTASGKINIAELKRLAAESRTG